MDLKITGTPKEIADLVLGIQSQQTDELIEKLNLYGVVQKEQILREADEKYLYNLAEREVNLAFGTPKEIADLVLGIQNQQTDELINVANEKKPTKNQFSGFGNSLMQLSLPASKEEVCSFLVKEMNRVTEKELAESFVDFIIYRENSIISIQLKFDC